LNIYALWRKPSHEESDNAAVGAAMLAGVWFTAAMVKPPLSKAITMVEMPA